MHRLLMILTGILALPQAAHAAPGQGDDADSAIVEQGSVALGVAYHRLAGGPDDGQALLQTAATLGLSNRVRIGAQATFERIPGERLRASSIGIEALYALGRVGPVDIAIYGTYDLGIEGSDTVEGRLIAQHTSGPIDLRFNLVGAREMATGQRVELAYALAADLAVSPRVQLGIHGFGEFGSQNGLLPNGGHAMGPVASFALGGPARLRMGYLFTVGSARQDTSGQLRLGLEFGF